MIVAIKQLPIKIVIIINVCRESQILIKNIKLLNSYRK